MATCLLGASQTFDAVRYVRSMLEDDSSTPTITDNRMIMYIETVAEDFSRHLPLDDIVGTPNTHSSPFTTSPGQQRYVLNTTNGFAAPPLAVRTVQTSTSGLNAGNDSAYFFLTPYVPGILGPSAVDSPASRVVRNEYLAELDWYGRTYYDLVRDVSTGLPAIDFYPIPQASYPIYVRYQRQHQNTGQLFASQYPTIPEEHKRNFADLLYAQCLFEQAQRLALSGNTKLGQIEVSQSAEYMRELAHDVRQRVYSELGATSPVALVG